MKLTKILICLLIFWTGTLSASPYFSFKKYQVEDGLSHNTVWCALQDSYGSVSYTHLTLPTKRIV